MALAHISKIQGIGGRLKAVPEDFMVEEICCDGTVLEIGKVMEFQDQQGPYTRFIMQKTNWSTASAISEIASRVGANQRVFNIAGTKDKHSISTQLVSAHGIPKERLLALKIKDISILAAWTTSDRLHLGDLLGNRFTIILRDTIEGSHERCAEIQGELDGRFPNYFGEQRFGSSRKNTHQVGLKILQGDVEGAAMMYLCESTGEKNPLVLEARRKLKESRNFRQALKDFPKHMALERSMLSQLERHPDDYANSFKRLPRNILLLFIHAFQSHLFNTLLSERITEGVIELEEGEYFCGETLGFPDISKSEGEGWICGKLIGYGTPLNQREKDLLEAQGLAKEAFKLKHLPEIASRGSYRTLMAPLKGLSFTTDGSRSMRFRMELPAGSYATVAMGEFMDAR